MTTTIDGTELTGPDLLELLVEFNADAKTYSRRGRGAQDHPGYGDAHASIDQVLTALGY